MFYIVNVCQSGVIDVFIFTIFFGASIVHGMAGMQVLEWNGIPLMGKTYEVVQSIVGQQSGEVEICLRL